LTELSVYPLGFAAKLLIYLTTNQLPKLNVVGSIPIARSKSSVPCQRSGTSLGWVRPMGANFKERRETWSDSADTGLRWRATTLRLPEPSATGRPIVPRYAWTIRSGSPTRG